jgi:threonine synthase
MKYISTRGDSKPRTFSEAVLEGLADDGGLLVPDQLPDLSGQWPDWIGLTYPELAVRVLQQLAPDFTEQALRTCCESAYGSNYGAEVAPLNKVGPYHLLELIHGPTLAFKDVALQLLGRLFGVILEERGEELNIVAATSGDTGSAAIHGLKDVPRVKLFVTHPDGRIALLQRRQMTTVVDDSIFNIAVSGTFDDCQRMVKELSGDLKFKRRFKIGAVNSINFARIAAQVVYYFAAYLQTEGASQRVPAVMAVPTGNFGNILAAEYARRMGLPIAGLVLASNENDILPKFFQTGEYSRGEAQATHSPAMDIQVASNFERYLYLLAEGDGFMVRRLMAQFSESGRLSMPAPQDGLWRALSCSNRDTLQTVKKVLNETGRLLDPHTATAWWAMEQCQDQFNPEHAKIVVATAHPAKFPDILKQAVNSETEGLTHPTLSALANLPERLFHLPPDTERLKEFVSQGVEAGSGGVFLAAEEKAGRHG